MLSCYILLYYSTASRCPGGGLARVRRPLACLPVAGPAGDGQVRRGRRRPGGPPAPCHGVATCGCRRLSCVAVFRRRPSRRVPTPAHGSGASLLLPRDRVYDVMDVVLGRESFDPPITGVAAESPLCGLCAAPTSSSRSLTASRSRSVLGVVPHTEEYALAFRRSLLSCGHACWYHCAFI